MAELLLKVGTVGPDPRYQDGDIVCAWNGRMISQRHLSIIADPRLLAPGHRPVDSHCFDYYETLCMYKFERVSPTEMLRTNLHNLAEVPELLGPIPNAKGEQVKMGLYLAHQLKSRHHKIFGVAGAEIWFGGVRKQKDPVRLDAIWAKVEARSGLLKADHLEFPVTDMEKRHFLPISIVEFSDAEMAEFLGSDIEDVVEDGEEFTRPFQIRFSNVDWENLNGMNPGRRAQVRDGGRSADHRQSLGIFDRSIVERKAIIGRRSDIRI